MKIIVRNTDSSIGIIPPTAIQNALVNGTDTTELKLMLEEIQ